MKVTLLTSSWLICRKEGQSKAEKWEDYDRARGHHTIIQPRCFSSFSSRISFRFQGFYPDPLPLEMGLLSCSGYSAMSTLYLLRFSMFDENLKTRFRISRWLHHLIPSDLSFGNNAILPINIRQCCTLLLCLLWQTCNDMRWSLLQNFSFYYPNSLQFLLNLDFWKRLTWMSLSHCPHSVETGFSRECLSRF